MKKYERIFVIVLDSLGIGAMPDSEKFGDVGVDTFGHILDKMGSLEIPHLKKLGGTGEALRQARDWKQERQRNGDH